MKKIQALFATFSIIALLICSGTEKLFAQITIGGYKGADCTFNTAAEIANGCTRTNYFTVQYGGFQFQNNIPAGWSVRVLANGNFSNGVTTVPAQYIAVSFASASGGPSGVTGTGYQTLSTTTAKNLITTNKALATPPTYYMEHLLNLRITGGNHLAVGTGTYTGSVTLQLVNSSGTVLASNNNIEFSFVVNFSNSCQGAAISAYSSNQSTFTSYSQQMAGATTTDALSVQYAPNGSTCNGWSLRVRAAGNFTNGASSVAPNYFAFRFNRVQSGTPTAAAIGVTNNSVALSTTDVPIINNSAAGFSGGTEHKFDMIIQGGNHLLVPNGTYTGTIILTLYNQNNEVVSTITQQISFAVNSTTNTFTVELQNAANEVDMVFNTVADFANGLSVSKSRGLKITGYNPYQVLVKTSSPNLVGQGSETIAVGAVSVEITKYTNSSGGITTTTRSLSTADQVVISNPMVDYTQQMIEYNLRYFTSPGDSRLNGKSGTFNVSVLFVVIPQ